MFTLFIKIFQVRSSLQITPQYKGRGLKESIEILKETEFKDSNKDLILYFLDEMRYGLMTNVRRSWSRVGERAVLKHQQSFANRYLFSAVAPLTGRSFHLMDIDEMDTEAEVVFLRELKKQHPNENIVLVWDNAPCHRSKRLREIPCLAIIQLPSYSPKLNPAERFFEEIRRSTANVVFEGISEIEIQITVAVNSWTEDLEAMKQLLGYGWIKEQCSGVV